jgi:diguanylate cyclase (GGDEF)-like protein
MTFKFSLRARLLILLAGIFIAVALFSAFRAFERLNSDTEFTQAALLAQAKFIATQQADSVRRTERMLEFLATSLNTSALAKDPECVSKLQKYSRNDDYLANIFITDLHGVSVCNPRINISRVNIADRDYFEKALRTNRPVAGDPVFGRYTKRWVLPFAQRFTNKKGEVEGVVVVALDLGWVEKSFKNIDLPNGLRVGLITSKGIVLAREPDPEKWIGKDISAYPAFARLVALHGNGVAMVRSHDGQQRIYIFTPFAKTSADAIYLWLTIPREIATAKAEAQFKLDLALIAGLLAVSFILVWSGLSRLLMRPIEAIVLAARRIANGDLTVQTGLPHSSDEIGQLALSFDEMASQLSRVDAVTGLFNLHSFDGALTAMIADAKRSGNKIAIIRLQIREFQRIEVSYSIACSNGMIKAVGERLQRSMGSSGILARIGDSNFAIACVGLQDAVEANQVVERLQEDVEATPIALDGVSLNAELCFGISFFPQDGLSANDLLQHAGVALGLALNDAVTHLRFYEQAMNDKLLLRARYLDGLRQALQMDSFELYYQPQLDLRTGRLCGFEVLVRWNHPVDGIIPPDEFIGLAEESGLIVPLGDWILKQALSELIQWRSIDPALSSLVMAVNISAVQLAAPDFREKLIRLLAGSGVPAENVELEITESQLMSFFGEPHVVFNQLKDIGIQLAIDDFGTGYSSLSYLKLLAADKLKIDKSFVDNIVSDSDDAAIVEATIAMAHKLGLKVIAEGVEVIEQADYLRRLACDQIQGYVVSRPLPTDKALEFIFDSLGKRK